MIQKNIFQAWIGEVEPPPRIKIYMEKVKNQNPDWNYVLIQNKDLDDLYKQLPDNAKKIYDFHMERKEWGLVLDPIRFLLPYLHGGIFMDTDIKMCKGKSFNELPLEKNLILVNSFHSNFRPHTCWLAACQGNKFFKHLIDHMGNQCYEIPRRDVYNSSYLTTEYILRYEPERRERMVSAIWSIPMEVVKFYDDEEIIHPDIIINAKGKHQHIGICTNWPMSSHTINKSKYIKNEIGN
jgi:mannosyltransferase OCH1-like enzyme